jgi:hypothetical protein
MSLIVKPVPITYFHQTWPLVEEMFKSAAKFDSGDYTLDQIKTLLSNGTWLLLVAVDEQNAIHGTAAVSFFNMPNARVAFITSTAGKAIVNKDVYTKMCAILKEHGATKIQCAARESAARLYEKVGMTPRHTILEAIL